VQVLDLENLVHVSLEVCSKRRNGEIRELKESRRVRYRLKSCILGRYGRAAGAACLTVNRSFLGVDERLRKEREIRDLFFVLYQSLRLDLSATRVQDVKI
jgi:hypothetical protein